MFSRIIRSRILVPVLLLVLLSVSMIPAVVSAQSITCPDLVNEALAALDDNCDDLSSNSACYGYDLVRASFNQTVADNFFTLPSDKSELALLESIRTTALDLDRGRWGITVLSARANIPNTLPGQSVMFLLLGDTRIENRVDPEDVQQAAEPVNVTIQAGQRINIRSGPGTNHNVIITASPGETAQVDGQNEAGDWLRITIGETVGWVSRSLVGGADAAVLDALPALSDERFTPMQAFYFSTGIGMATCNDAPDLLVIQGPQNLQVSLNVNGAQIAIGSTVVLSSPNANLDAQAQSPFGPDASTVILPDGGFVYPFNGGSLRIVAGAAPGGASVALNNGVFLHPIDGSQLRITAGPDDDTGINNNGGIFADGTRLHANQPVGSGGIEAAGRVFIGPAPGGGLLVSAETGDLSALGGANGETGTENANTCRPMEMVVLDGQAQLNGGAIDLPIGHLAETEVCFNADGQVESVDDWENQGIVSQDELHERFGTLENIPPSVLNYPIRIPSQQQINAAISTPPPPPPPSDDDQPPVEPTEGTTVVGVDCSNFVGLSPVDGMAFGPQPFYWTAAPGADLYRVVVASADRPGVVTGDVPGGTLTTTIDIGVGALSQFGRGYDFFWSIQAFKAGAMACETEAIFQNREAISNEELCRRLGGSWDDACYDRNGGTIDMPT